jgi:hypothetical protein
VQQEARSRAQGELDMNRRIFGAALAALVAAAACGGSGGDGRGDNPWTIDLRPTLTATVFQGDAMPLEITGTARARPDVAIGLRVTVDGTVFSPHVVVAQQSELVYKAVVTTLPTLSASRHTGHIVVQACEDDPAVCARPFGQAATLAFDLDVVPPTGPTGVVTYHDADGNVTWTSHIQYNQFGGSHLSTGLSPGGGASSRWVEPSAAFGLLLDGSGFVQGGQAYDVAVVGGKTVNFIYDAEAWSSGFAPAHRTGYHLRTVASSGAETFREIYTCGPNGTCLDGDDVLQSTMEWHYPGDHFHWDSWDRAIERGPAGAITACVTHAFGAGTQLWTRESRYAPGQDGVCFTQDDVLTSYATATHSNDPI